MDTREYQAYLQGALHDGTRSDLHHTHRISQKGTGWLSRLKNFLAGIGHQSWMYQEGKTREVYVLETTAQFLDYVRGYFDTEGGLPQSPDARFYIQFTQKDRVELEKVKSVLERMGIECGEVHNPSAEVDPNYWRFCIRAKSHERFADLVGSWHPRKETILKQRMKI